MPVNRIFALCLRGIRHRMLRSMLTLAVVALAVAFLTYLLCENAIYLSVGRGLNEALSTSRLGIRLVTRVLTPLGDAEATRLLASAHADPKERGELAAVAGWSPERTAALAAVSAQELADAACFDRLSVGKRTLLIGRRTGREGLRHLVDPVRQNELENALRPMTDVRIPGGVQRLFAFVRTLPEIDAERQAFTRAWNARIAEARDALAVRAGAEAPDAWLAMAAEEEAEAWRLQTASLGFVLPPSRFDAARRQLADARLRRQLVQLLDSPAGRQSWRQAFQDPRTQPAERRMRLLDRPQARTALAAALAQPGETFPAELSALTPERLASIAATERREQRMATMERRLAPYLSERQGAGLTGRQQVLLAISFLVCMVGIANAMLMSITERFREIATLKCLGATDRYVLLQFLLEAGLQGATGGVLGVATGFLAAHVKGAIELGGYLWSYWPGPSLAGAAGTALLSGMLLSMLASLYPSWSASRMAPMEAMRIE